MVVEVEYLASSGRAMASPARRTAVIRRIRLVVMVAPVDTFAGKYPKGFYRLSRETISESMDKYELMAD